MKNNPEKPNAIEKTLDILEAFLLDNPEMGTVRISEKLGLHKATASRILLLLTQKGFLQQNPDTKKFSLGRMALLLGRSVTTSLENGIVSIAKPYVDALRTQIDETVALEQIGVEHDCPGLHCRRLVTASYCRRSG